MRNGYATPHFPCVAHTVAPHLNVIASDERRIVSHCCDGRRSRNGKTEPFQFCSSPGNIFFASAVMTTGRFVPLGSVSDC